MAAIPPVERVRTGNSIEELKRDLYENLFYVQGRFPGNATEEDLYLALAHTVRDRLIERWIHTLRHSFDNRQSRVVCYLSAEFLLGPHLKNNLLNLGICEQMKQAVTELGYDFEALAALEEEPGLGNGGLGRLAACFMDSLATLDIPAIGYGIRYEYGIFDQSVRDGWQVEITDKWLSNGNPWEIARPNRSVEVFFDGYTENYKDAYGRTRVRWVPGRVVKGVPHDTPILGFRTNTANLLRLWRAEAVESFDFAAFNTGDYFRAVEEKVKSETISKVLYPNDSSTAGKQLRLEQQFFFVSCSLQDICRAMIRKGLPLDRLHEHYAAQLNDTHPSIAVAELMRLLVDEFAIPWDTAWDITRKTLSYTNHTLLPEALEKWPLPLFQRLLPRHLQIIYDINARFLEEIRISFPDDGARWGRMSIIDESGERFVRMANLATIGCHKVNGVAELHTELLKKDVLRDFAEWTPDKFVNVTNGVTPRRFMLLANPRLAKLISTRIGDLWLKKLDELRRLEPFISDEKFREQWRKVKLANKEDLAAYIEKELGIKTDPNSMFDALVKRLHEYKRQHLKALHIIAMYLRVKDNPGLDFAPRTFIFGGKAAPGYVMAKLIIKLVHSVAEVVNNDPDVAGRLKVVFLPDFNVTLGQRIYPAADLSEQISTAGKEASGTGNMKFSLNGALTIGTLDGANVEIRHEVGPENFFLFGLTTDEVYERKAQGYNPSEVYLADPMLRRVVDSLISGQFSRGDVNLFRPLYDHLVHSDPYMLMADFASYLETQDKVSHAYRDKDRWTRLSILNAARCGKFSSDRSIKDYCERIWSVRPIGQQGPMF
jgi:starch phosphorylase